ncbi:hypothetical protein M408DRAFT_262720 [Serendipita vermifera MAFF 305830]|uniref:DUF6535 domain-containing protein n=1 Tax=Serendipita vermifera MAFF 305830 TaxID=933852 RepID=A0A0C2X240_SERVB|nr:hypothetical protein M408DRAFT_262720 [Serendipita vermifera MAFF 305830]
MDNSGQPEKAISVRSRLKSLKSVQRPALDDENSQDERLQPTNEAVDQTTNEPLQTLVVDKLLGGTAINLQREATVWDVYNNEAKKVDDELVKDWRDNLSSLLLFAAIFAAVLTAFIIESKKMLEQDQTELLVSVTIFGINNMGNASNLPFVPPTFVPTSAAISINCLLFSSLGTSLVAALAAVVSLQWVADYDAAITRGGSTPEDRAKRRQFRFAGVVNWKMEGIIASLPLLLYFSVALFWVGATRWMWMLHTTVGSVVAGGTVMAILFYVSTTLVAAIYVSAPFKTPLSRGVYWVHQNAIYLARELISPILEKEWLPEMPKIGFSVRFIIVATTRFIVLAVILPVRLPFLALVKFISWLDARSYLDTIKRCSPQWAETISQAFKGARSWSTSHQTRLTSRQREDRAAAADLSLTQQALAWLADQIIYSANSNSRLQLLVEEVVKQFPRAQPLGSPSSEPTALGSVQSAQAIAPDSFTDTSWLKIFDSLGWHYLRKILDGTLSGNDHETIGFLVERSRAAGVWEILSKHDSQDISIQSNEWGQFSFDASQVTRSQEMESVNMAFLLARDVPIPSPGSDHELRLTIRLIKWRNSGVREMAYPHSDHYSSEYLKSYVLYLKRFLRFAEREHYKLDDYIPLWSLARDEEVRHELMLELLEEFDKLVEELESAEIYSDLIGMVIKDIARSYEHLPSFPTCSSDIHLRLANIKDPLLSLLGSFAVGIYNQHGIMLSTRYVDTCSDLLDLLLFQRLSSNDSPFLWHLRALLWPAAPKSRERLCSLALEQPEYISHLQRIFDHQIRCMDHSSGPQHLLYHLCMESGRFSGFPEHTILFGNSYLNELCAYFILALFALPEDQPFSSITPLKKVPAECTERVGAMCQAVKKDSLSTLQFLTDIARSCSFDHYHATNVAAILESTQRILSNTDHPGSIFHLLRPLEHALRHLNGNMLKESHVDMMEDERQVVAGHAKRICSVLETTITATTQVVFSSSQLQLLSCARPGGTGQPALGWMEIYTEI